MKTNLLPSLLPAGMTASRGHRIPPTRASWRTLTRVALLAWIAVATLLPASLRGATRTVTTLADTTNPNDGVLSLREAIAASVNDDVINFSVAGTITLTSGELVIDKNLTVQGSGAASLRISANNASRVLRIASGQVRVEGLTLTDGRVVGSDGTTPFEAPGTPGQPAVGGAILNLGELTVAGCTISNSAASGGRGGNGPNINSFTDGDNGGAGGAAFGGGICNSNLLVLVNSTLSFNTVVGGGGGTGGRDVAGRLGGSAGAGSGGGIFNAGTLRATNCLISFNTAASLSGGAGGSGQVQVGGTGGRGGDTFGGGIANARILVLAGCSFYTNSCSAGTGGAGGGSSSASGGTGGNGGLSQGAGLHNDYILTAYNCTFNRNTGYGGTRGAGGPNNGPAGNGGDSEGGGIYNRATCQFVHVTLTQNRAWVGTQGTIPGMARGGGLCAAGVTTRLINTLVALNELSPGGAGPDAFGPVTSDGHNLVRATDGSSGWTGTDLTGTVMLPLEPLLIDFADWGGPTFTHALCWDSPARDAGDDTVGGLSTDQRGLSRTNGAHVDIGAFELRPEDTLEVQVTTLGDGPRGSLRHALACVAPGGTITFAPYLRSTIILTSGELIVNKSVNILGSDPRYLGVSGNNASRVFNVTAGTNVVIAGLTIRDGLLSGGAISQGGGVFNQVTLTLSNCTFFANAARGVNGANGTSGTPTGGPGTSAIGGAIYNAPGGSLTLAACSFALNEARGGNGGNGRTGTFGGGNGGPAGNGSGGAVGSDGPLTVLNCTFSTNRVFGGTGGAGAPGGTFDGNGGNGGNADSGAILNRNIANLVHLTVVANETTLGARGSGGEFPGTPGSARAGGIYSVGPSTLLLNSLVASNRAATAGPDVSGTFFSVGRNLIAITNGSTGWQATDLTGSAATPLEPRLGGYGWNLGLTPNYALQTDSPALNAGNNLSQGNPWFLTTDQRGFPRRSSGTVDIGAYELCRDVPAFEVTTLEDAVPGSLRAAIECITPGGTITFAPGVTGLIHIACCGGGFEIDKDLTLIGPGADRLSIQTTNGRIFRVASGRVHISGLNISGGAHGARGLDTFNLGENGGAGGDGEGGGILNFGDLTVSDCMFTYCRAVGGWGGTGGPNSGITAPGTGGAGGAGLGGGVCNRGQLTLLRCTFANNYSYGGIGGIGGDDGNIGSTPGGPGGLGGDAVGGALYNAGTLFTTNCTFVTNFVFAGTGGRGGFGIPGGGTGGDGGLGLGAGFCDDGTATLVSCKLTANRGFAGGFGTGGTGTIFTGGNGTDGLAAGGGMNIYHNLMLPYTFVRNTLSAGNASESGSDAFGVAASGGFNFIGTAGDGNLVIFNQFIEPTDIVGLAPTVLIPRFGSLGYHGGTTLTLALNSDSPALDRGHRSGASTDQRGVSRPIDLPSLANATGGDGSDIGAYEMEGVPNLSIRLGAPSGGFNNVVLSWLNLSTGYVLQQTPSMNAPGGGWVDVAQPPVIVGPNKEVTLPATGAACMFRLRGP